MVATGRARRAAALLDWETVCTKLPWGPLFVLGGGYALADAFEVSAQLLRLQLGALRIN